MRFFESVRELLAPNLQNIYGEVHQKSLESKPGGYVEIAFMEEKDEAGEPVLRENTLARVLDTVQRLQAAGHPLKDVTVLCRTNREGSLVARHLLENRINVISSDSLLLNQSGDVNFVCALLRLAARQDDRVAAVEVLSFLNKTGGLPAGNSLHHWLQEAGLFAASNSGTLPSRAVEEVLNRHGISWNFSMLLNQNIYDACETILRAFFPDQTPPNPFLAFFMDVVFDYSEKINLSVTDFLEWWQKEGGKFSLEMPEGLDAVQIMTIHRAKGLQFPVVIYPFAQPGRAKNTRDGQWADLELDVVPQLPATWVSLTKAGTQNTPFEPLLETENERSFLDLLNVIYVAFTRPQQKLFVISSAVSRDKKTGQPNPGEKTINGMLYRFLTGKNLWNESQSVFSLGDLESVEGKDTADPATENRFSRYLTSPWHRAIRLKSHQSERGLTLPQPGHLEKGNLLHRAMESIQTPGDTGPVLARMMADGEIDEPTSQQWADKIDRILSHPILQDCFNPEVPSRSEAGIFVPGGQFFRPDRVVFMSQQTIIIDYKTGKEYPAHVVQMETSQNYLTEEALEATARYLKLTKASVYGVAGYYTMFSLKPRGRHIIRVCVSAVCELKKSDSVIAHLESTLGIKTGQTTPCGLFTLELSECIGQCHEAPSMMIGQAVYNNLDAERIREVIESIRNQG
jgi:NADH:ubiquinone oxidoreductase subunit E